MKHILFITPGFAKDEGDSSSVTYFLNYLKELRVFAPNLEISIIALDYPFEADQYTWYGCRVFAYGLFGKSRIGKLKQVPKIINAIKNLHKNKEIDIIHSLWLNHATILAQYVSRKLNIPIVATAMGMEFINKSFYLRFITKSTSIVFVSQFQKMNTSLSRSFDSVDCIPWGVDKQKHFPDQRANDVLFVGYLNKNKNFTLALNIFKELIVRQPKLKIRVIGDFYNVNDWIKKADEMGVLNHVSFLGKLENEKVIHHMKNSKVLLHTSNYESLGYVMLEALSCGMYVVSREIGVAKQSKHWKLASNKSEFLLELRTCLNEYTFPGGYVPHSIHKTVEMYKEVYTRILFR